MVETSSYLVHKIDQLWKEVESLKSRVEKLEKMVAEGSRAPAPQSQPEVKLPASSPPQNRSIAVDRTDPVVRLLREKGSLNIIQLNSELRNLGIAETVRDTLFKRVKKLMEAGKVGFDEKTQTFFAR